MCAWWRGPADSRRGEEGYRGLGGVCSGAEGDVVACSSLVGGSRRHERTLSLQRAWEALWQCSSSTLL